jgi:sigma-B regulation protein RsbU (phosphoserine phosphatase)
MTHDKQPVERHRGVDDAFYAALLEDDAEELYDAAPCAYFSALPDGTIIKVNGTFLTWTGYDRRALVGHRRFQDLLGIGDRIFYETHLAPALRMQGQVREIAVDLVTESGARLPVLLNAVLKEDEAGSPVVIRAAVIDATERRAYERELLAARRQAEESERRARALAHTLQRSFLPPEILPVPGLNIAGAYRPAGDGSEVGGDFYDVFQTGHDTWGVVLGDVCGKGAEAAALTSLARYTVRAEAVHASRPRDVLTRLHSTLLQYHPDQFCTAVYVVLDGGPDRSRMTVSTGGHDLPLRIAANGHLDVIGSAGSILGMIEASTLSDTTVPLAPGDVVVLYTDGVTEARRNGEFFGEERLRATIHEVAAKEAQDIADAIVTAALDFQGGDAKDDIAVVVIKVPRGDLP